MARALPLVLLALLMAGCLLPEIDSSDWDGDGTPDVGDCDPNDPTLNQADVDGDGNTTCFGDCDDEDPTVEGLDRDGDGASTCGGDCDDTNVEIAPGLEEACDGDDTNCDGVLPEDEVDEDNDGAPLCADCDDDDSSVQGIDADGDHFDPCDEPVDCDETDPEVHPGADDDWGDGDDQNCDGIDGEDGDGDGYAANASVGSGDYDCADDNPAIHEGADEVCDGRDSDCSGGIPADEVDLDSDGWIPCVDYVEQGAELNGGGDCEDGIEQVHPSAEEVACDGFDTDCDGSIEDAELDGDGDQYLPCTPFSDLEQGFLGGDDCDDEEAAVHPDADEGCDGLDTDCSGDGVSYDELDADNDLHVPCSGWSGDASLSGGDCDDSQPGINPGAVEHACDGVNTDCAGVMDPDEMDDDGDGYLPCLGYTENGGGFTAGGDCDDAQPDVNPGEAEHICDGVDTDCDGAPLESDEADSDGDGWLACSGYGEHGGGFLGDEDCDDSEAGVNPAATEVCDGRDTDCTGGGLDIGEADQDGDHWVVCTTWVDNGGGVLGGGDCNDYGPEFHPGATEDCDGWDTNCDGVVEADEIDGDADGWLTCVGWMDRGAPYDGGADCDGLNGDVYPGAPEAECDGLDTDCADGPLLAEQDVDGDGWLACEVYTGPDGDFFGGGDCDDGLDTIHPATGWDDPTDSVDSDCGAGTHTWLGRADATVVGAADDWAGWAVTGIGDVDGDGLGEVVVAAIGGANDTGIVGLFYASSLAAGGSLDLASADVLIEGNEYGDQFGHAVASAGDLSGDGFDELAIGAPDAGGTGQVYIFSSVVLATPGPLGVADAMMVVSGVDPGGQFGWSLAGGGDAVDDAALDLLVGAPSTTRTSTDVGAVFAFSGQLLATAPVASSDDAELTVVGSAAGQEVGYSVALLADTSGDNHDELVVGATGVGGGAVYVVFGDTSGEIPAGSADVILQAEAGTDGAGYALATGDFDGDGAEDLAVGATEAGGVGKVYVVPGSVLTANTTGVLSVADDVLSGDPSDDQFGASLCAGDVDGDGYADLLVGAPDNDLGGLQAGGTWLFLGSSLDADVDPTADEVFIGNDRADESGTSVAIVDDLDGDGRGDIIIGGPVAGGTGVYAGEVRVLLSP